MSLSSSIMNDVIDIFGSKYVLQFKGWCHGFETVCIIGSILCEKLPTDLKSS